MNSLIYILPFLGALLGWLINAIVIRISLRKISGRKPELAQQLGALAKKEFAFFNIEEKISDPSNFKKAMPFVEDHVDNFLRHKLKEQMPMIGMFIGDKTIQSLKDIFMKELETLFPEMMKQFAGNIKDEIDIEQIVMKKINELPANKVEETLGKEMKPIAIAGAITGFVIGFIEVLFTLVVK